MQILIAEDDLVSRTVLTRMLTNWGHEVLATADGRAAWEILEKPDAPRLAILDWMMPEVDGVELCQRVRSLARPEPTYLILLTAKHQKEDIVEGLDAGANDYVVKPFDRRELESRVRVGLRVIRLQEALNQRVQELQHAMAQIHQLHELLPMCSYCKKIRDDQSYWQQLDTYLTSRTGVHFSHGVCPECYQNVLADLERAGV